MMVMNTWNCSYDGCDVTLEIDNQLGYDIVLNAICDGEKIIKVEVKPYA